MASRYSQGLFQPQNPDKFIGGKLPFARSSWETKFMQFCDSHPNILKWASENVKIPYRNPMTGKITNYVPDFMVQYQDKNGKTLVELIEIKPKSQTVIENARGRGDKLATMVNAAKWTAAQEWCKAKGIHFKVITEEQIFNKPKRTTKPRKKSR
ncbi:TnsA endonuclease N-terminal domain-containing protein [bacterium]|jgi:hypothetical protein|nr:TnsA endonuclease N-terminal domain-containing protein [bacterium]